MPAHDAIALVIALALDVAFPALLLVAAGTRKTPGVEYGRLRPRVR
jgi:hypothetical protein